ncbi:MULTISPECIES: EAL domain-containing protein [Gammaproteobacteria]|uniref:EAL domain-containing protein n=1 Tax=Gammaproteobacteria TaxID=1236 RepID=UPI000DD0ECCB|nr:MULTISPECIES: EAL domain-containing protein [Gammaproteobacteria]RTE86580.1 EAL domain-containing protein [Aliidiomarina sp. B3213]TCZ90865.1 EAL domain-containing protein [Lysobacter sp. N42]
MEKSTFVKLEELRSDYLRSLVGYVNELEVLKEDFTKTKVSLDHLIWICHRLSGSGQAYGFSKLSILAKETETKARNLEIGPAFTEQNSILISLESLISECNTILSNDEVHAPYLPTPPHKYHQQGRKVNLLLIDDDPEFSVYLSEQLQDQGYEVHYLANIHKLSDTVDTLAPLAVLVDMDFYGDQFAGSKAVSSWREKNGHPLPVIFISAYDTYKTRLSAVQAGGNYFLRKPIDLPKLLSILSREIEIAPLAAYRILIVDDDTDLLQLYRETLLEAGYQVYVAASALEALETIETVLPDLILLDVHMPDCSGIELGKLIHQHEDFSTVPLLFMSSYGNTDVELACARLSSDEFINKPIEPWRLLMTIKPRVERGRKVLRSDVHANKKEYEIDHLTALPKLDSLMALIPSLSSGSNDGGIVVLAKLDIRDFHTINNIYGPYIGDELLQRLTQDISEKVSDGDSLFRDSGDELYVLLAHYTSVELAQEQLKNIAHTVTKERVIQSHTVMPLSADIGAVVLDDSLNADEIISRAEVALSSAKKELAPSIILFEDSMKAEEQIRFTLAQEIQKGLENQEFTAVYQPIVDVDENSLVGAEVLSRWNHPTKGMLPPSKFISFMEEKNLVPLLTDQMLERSLTQLKIWQKRIPDFVMSINLSTRDIETPRFIERLRKLIERHELQPNSILLEVTETSLLADWEQAQIVIAAIKKMGVQVALDDFGTGYSSLNYLNRIPADKLKIDRSFIQAWSKTRDARLVTAMVSLGKSLGMSVVAEGIESKEELAFMQEIGCDQYQGFVFAKPMTPEVFSEHYLK